MSEQRKEILKSYFTKNAIPTAAQFADLIDSYLNTLDSGITVNETKNIGFGNTNPSSNIVVQSRESLITGQLNAVAHTKTITGVSTIFSEELKINQVISINGVSHTVETITNNETLDVKENIATAFVAAKGTVIMDVFSVENIAGNAILHISGNGNIGVHKMLPDKLFDVNGDVQAINFFGNGENVTNIKASNVSGELLASQIPKLSPDKVNQYCMYGSDKSIITGENTFTLHWKTDVVDSIALKYIDKGKIVTKTEKNGLNLKSGSLTLSPYQDTIYTLTGKNKHDLKFQQQIIIQVIQTVNQYGMQLRYEGYGIKPMVERCGDRFGLEVLNKVNLTALATAVKKAGYTPEEAFRSIPRYYRNQGETWSVKIDGGILSKIFGG